ncbi:MAG TPA: nucleotidyltransferase family protein, partial [Solirubrobacteraceae bacterium]
MRDLLRQLTPADAGSFFDLAASHQVLPQVHRQLARSADDASPAGRDLVERLGAAVAAIERSLDVHARALDDLAAEAVARVTAIKGAALARLYDESTGRREMRDVDLWTPTPSLWPLVAHLVDRGYGVHKVRVGQYGGSGAPPAHGICPLTLAGDDGGRDTVEIDLHFGAFPALGEGLVPL